MNRIVPLAVMLSLCVQAKSETIVDPNRVLPFTDGVFGVTKQKDDRFKEMFRSGGTAVRKFKNCRIVSAKPLPQLNCDKPTSQIIQVQSLQKDMAKVRTWEKGTINHVWIAKSDYMASVGNLFRRLLKIEKDGVFSLSSYLPPEMAMIIQSPESYYNTIHIQSAYELKVKVGKRFVEAVKIFISIESEMDSQRFPIALTLAKPPVPWVAQILEVEAYPGLLSDPGVKLESFR